MFLKHKAFKGILIPTLPLSSFKISPPPQLIGFSSSGMHHCACQPDKISFLPLTKSPAIQFCLPNFTGLFLLDCSCPCPVTNLLNILVVSNTSVHNMPILSPVCWLQESRTNLSWAVARGSVYQEYLLILGPK